jgi:hypothetical protein
MNIIELIIDENEELSGIDAVSVVERPAIEEDFVALQNQDQVLLKKVNDEKRLLVGAGLIPDKPIYRRNGEQEFYIYFSKDTVRKASQMFFKKGNQNKATLEHQDKYLEGMTIVESWIVEDTEKDKSNFYGFNYPVGTWVIAMKVDNDDVWEKVKNEEIKGFSIEGYFADKLQRPQDKQKDQLNKHKVNEDYMIIDDRLAYSSKEKAEKMAVDLGCKGYHEHEVDGQTWFMPCEQHSVENELLNKIKDVVANS